MDDLDDGPRLGWRTPLIAAALYVACVSIATFPVVRTFSTELPGSRLDPLQHLWIMRWYKTCLLEWRSPVICPEIQYPTGAPLGNFSPLHFQALLYLPISLLTSNDVLCFNLIWMTGLVTSGLGTLWLAWHVVRDRSCAVLAGMLAMLSGPMMLHARAHLELIFLGCFPAFMVCWMRFVDRPSRRRLAAAAGAYVLVALCAAYYVVFATIPATLYVLWRARGLRARAGWLAAFAASVVPALALVFSNQIWAMTHGYSTPRPIAEFNRYGTALWTYLTPTCLHAISAIMPFNAYAAADYGWSVGERASYLGIVTLGLLYLGAVRRVRFERAGYWWSALIVLAVLSCGAYWLIGSAKVGLPALWLKKSVFAFKLIRVPARFNLFVAVVASVLAAASLKHLLDRIDRRGARLAVVVGLVLVALADQSNVPFGTEKVPPLPRGYTVIRRRDPDARFLDVPQSPSTGSGLSSVCGYWQSLHRGRTSAGYSGHDNVPFDDLVTFNSPFAAGAMAQPDYLARDEGLAFDVVQNLDFEGYAWLYLTAHGYDYVVLHQWPGASPEFKIDPTRLKQRLASAKVYEDAATAIYSRAKMRPPTRPVALTTAGWRTTGPGQPARVVPKTGRMLVYNPAADRPIRVALEAKAFRRARRVRLESDGRELARWTFAPDDFETKWSPPLRLAAGLHDVRLISDGEDRPVRGGERARESDTAAYSLKVRALGLVTLPVETPSRIAAETPPALRK